MNIHEIVSTFLVSTAENKLLTMAVINHYSYDGFFETSQNFDQYAPEFGCLNSRKNASDFGYANRHFFDPITRKTLQFRILKQFEPRNWEHEYYWSSLVHREVRKIFCDFKQYYLSELSKFLEYETSEK